MSSIDPALRAVPPSPLSALLFRYAPAVYGLTLFVSALLLFAVQPMFTKIVLPTLGGAPAIWSVAMVFFQGCLLLGYAYAHLISSLLRARKAALVHLVVLGAAALSLPIGIASGFGNPPSHGIEIWLLGLFAVSIGLPFTALAATAPLLQRWFADSRHEKAANPYVLYAASNLGSFAALLAYPLLLEPLITLHGQAMLWSAGFALLAIMIAAAGLVIASQADDVKAARELPAAAVSFGERLTWIALAAVPSGLVVAVTAYISTDIAAAPFLWVLPLALFLLTFVAVFRDRPWISHERVTQIAPYLIAPLAVSLLGGVKVFWVVTIVLHLAAFFVITLLCHGELYRRRPVSQRLTDFYLATSIGGVIGGIFTGLIAPNIFSNTTEYPILIAAAVLVLPGVLASGLGGAVRQMLPGLVAALAVIALHYAGFRVPKEYTLWFLVALIALVGVMLMLRERPAQLFGVVVFAFVLTGFWQPGQNIVEISRSFFGVHKIVDSADGTYRVLYHGTTVHGAQRLLNADGSTIKGKPETVAYYYPGGPISQAFEATRRLNGKLTDVAVVGLGAGTLACFRADGEQWTFFEIDPEVVRIAKDPSRFRFLSSCAPDMPIVLGDARLTVTAQLQRFDLIMIDAFSSDAVPTHLLTREAMRGYLKRLKPNGVIVMNISNRHLELGRLVTAVAEAEGLIAMLKTDTAPLDFEKDLRANALVAVVARRYEDMKGLEGLDGWERGASNGVAPWTDDYSDLISSLVRKKF